MKIMWTTRKKKVIPISLRNDEIEVLDKRHTENVYKYFEMRRSVSIVDSFNGEFITITTFKFYKDYKKGLYSISETLKHTNRRGNGSLMFVDGNNNLLYKETFGIVEEEID